MWKSKTIDGVEWKCKTLTILIPVDDDEPVPKGVPSNFKFVLEGPDFLPSWPDFKKIPFPYNDRILIGLTIGSFYMFDDNGQLAALYSRQPTEVAIHNEPWDESRVFGKEYDSVAIEFLARTIKDPKAPAFRLALVKAGEILSGEDQQYADELLDRLRRGRGGWGKGLRFYDELIFRLLKRMSDRIRGEWKARKIYWKNMPTPEQAAIEYYLTVYSVANGDLDSLLHWWGYSDEEELRDKLLEKVQKFDRRKLGV
jgi:hypothetical protein